MTNVNDSEESRSNVNRELNITDDNETALDRRATGGIAMFAWGFLATLANAAHQCFRSDLVVVVISMVVVAGVFIVTCMLVMAIAIVIAKIRGHNMLMLTMPVRITRASMMKAAPEYRVQQNCCDGHATTEESHAIS